MNLRSLQSYSINKEFYGKFYREVVKRDKGEKIKGNPNANGQPNAKSSAKSSAKPNAHGLTTTVFNSLFWTFYSLVNNEQEVVLEQNKFKTKNAFALKFVETIKKEKVFLKQHKLRFHDIESSILYDKDITLPTLKCLVLHYKINLVYCWNNKYYIFESNDEDKFFYIDRNREKYTCDRHLEKSDIINSKMKNKLFMEDVRTELKSLGSYKVDELKTMAEILNISINTDDGKRKTKQQLYEAIITKID